MLFPRALLVVAAISIASSLTTTRAGAQSAPSAAIKHGSELNFGMVGPLAMALSPRETFPGGEIRDDRAYPFARSVPVGAIYDGIAVTGPHLLIERVRFTGPIDIYARKPVVLRGVSVRTQKAAPWAIHTRPASGPLLFLWSEAGGDSADGAPNDLSRAQQRALYLRGDGATIYRSYLSRSADGIQIHGRNTRVIETLIDDLVYWQGDHNDGIQMLGRGAEATIMRSRIVNRNPQTSCLNLIGDRVLVENSYLSGGGWLVYAGADNNGKGPGRTREVVFRGNVFGREHFPKGGHFGPVAYWDASPGTGNVWALNRFADGTPVQPAPARGSLGSGGR